MAESAQIRMRKNFLRGGRKIHTVSADEQILPDAALAAADLVIASPLYWYSVSAGTNLISHIKKTGIEKVNLTMNSSLPGN